MANEVTINIESSLAAMAFVIADQQECIKELRESVNQVQKESDDWRDAYDKTQNDLESAKRTIEETEKCVNELEEVRDRLYKENKDLEAKITSLRTRALDWHSFEGELEFDVSDYNNQPTVLILVEVIMNGRYDNNGNPEPIGERYIYQAMFINENGKYKLNHNDCYTRIVSWCEIGKDNIDIPEI